MIPDNRDHETLKAQAESKLQGVQKVNKTFTTFVSRKDAALTAFRADDNEALLNEICCNSATAHSRKGRECVLVPNHAASAVTAHLVQRGWMPA